MLRNIPRAKDKTGMFSLYQTTFIYTPSHSPAPVRRLGTTCGSYFFYNLEELKCEMHAGTSTGGWVSSWSSATVLLGDFGPIISPPHASGFLLQKISFE